MTATLGKRKQLTDNCDVFAVLPDSVAEKYRQLVGKSVLLAATNFRVPRLSMLVVRLQSNSASPIHALTSGMSVNGSITKQARTKAASVSTQNDSDGCLNNINTSGNAEAVAGGIFDNEVDKSFSLAANPTSYIAYITALIISSENKTISPAPEMPQNVYAFC